MYNKAELVRRCYVKGVAGFIIGTILYFLYLYFDLQVKLLVELAWGSGVLAIVVGCIIENFGNGENEN